MRLRSVFIEGMKLYMKCGVQELERKLGVQVEVSVKVTSEEFVDYQELHDQILAVSDGVFTYIEDFQDRLLEAIIDKWKPKEVIIRTVKISLPFQHNFERAGVELRWKREK